MTVTELIVKLSALPGAAEVHLSIFNTNTNEFIQTPSFTVEHESTVQDSVVLDGVV